MLCSCHRRELYPSWVREAVACLSDRPLHHINGTALRGQLSRVNTAWVGLGPRCRGKPAGCYEPGSGHLPPTPRLTAAWRTLVNRCFGQDPGRHAPLEPLQLLVVDRPYGAGRCVCRVGRVGTGGGEGGEAGPGRRAV